MPSHHAPSPEHPSSGDRPHRSAACLHIQCRYGPFSQNVLHPHLQPSQGTKCYKTSCSNNQCTEQKSEKPFTHPVTARLSCSNLGSDALEDVFYVRPRIITSTYFLSMYMLKLPVSTFIWQPVTVCHDLPGLFMSPWHKWRSVTCALLSTTHSTANKQQAFLLQALTPPLFDKNAEELWRQTLRKKVSAKQPFW